MLRSAATANRTLGASESEMKHETIRRCRPVPAALAAEGVALCDRGKQAAKTIRVRLFKD
jgi:hypothetical protein